MNNNKKFIYINIITLIPFVIFLPKSKRLKKFSVGKHDNSQLFKSLIFIDIVLFFIEFCLKEGRRKDSKTKTSYILQ